MQKKNKTKKGFTLIELVIVVAVIAVLSAVLIPTFTGIITTAKVEKARANAKNCSNLLKIEAAYRDVSYFSTETAKDILAEKGYDLKSDVKDYSYYYNLGNNSVEFLKDSDVLGRGESTAGYGGKTVYADDLKKTYPITVETVNEKKSYYRYLDNGGAFSSVISAIKNLPKNAGNNLSEMKKAFRNLRVNSLPEVASAHFGNFNPDGNALYFGTDGTPIIDDSKVEYTFVNVVFQEDIKTLADFTANVPDGASATGAKVTLKIINSIVVPETVEEIEKGAFRGFKGGSVSDPEADEKVRVVITSDVRLPSSGLTDVIISSGEANSNPNTIILGAGDYTLTYGYLKEGVFKDDTIEVVRAESDSKPVTLDKSGYTKNEAELVREYYVPQIGIEKSVVDLSRVETLDFRYDGKETGLRRYTMIVLMKDGTTYVARDIAVITQASVRYGDYNRYGYQDLFVYMNEDVAKGLYTNLRDMQYTIEYQEMLVPYKEYETDRDVFMQLYIEDTAGKTQISGKPAQASVEYDSVFETVQWTLYSKNVTNKDATDGNAPGYSDGYKNAKEDGVFNRVNVTELNISLKYQGSSDFVIYREYYKSIGID